MVTATMTSRGQITVPISVRTALGIDAGSRVEFVEVVRGRFEIIAATEPVQSRKGMIRRPAAPVSVEQMNDAIAKLGSSTK